MKKLLPLAMHSACVVALSLIAPGVGAQESPPGRTAFDKAGCRSCHAYSSRRGAPSVRDMLATFEGEPEKALKSFDQDEKHAIELMTGTISEKEVRAIAEWISGTKFPEPEEPEPVLAATPAPPPAAIPAATAAPVVATTAVAVEAAKPGAAGKVTAITIEPGKKADLLVINVAGRQPDELDIQNADGKLVIRMPNVTRADNVPQSLTANSARTIGTVTTNLEDGALVIGVTARSGDLKYTAIQGRNRLSVELASIPSKKVPAAPVAATAKATSTAPATPPVAKTTAKSAPTTTATAGKSSTGTATAAAGAPAVAVGATAALAKAATPDTKKTVPETKKPEPVAKAPIDDPKVKAKQEAEAKAKKDADTLAAQKREQEAQAAQQKSAASDAAKKEAELLASLKLSADSLQAGMAGMSGASTARKDRSKMKAPEKFRNEPCPPIENSDPIGNVDEAKAKSIIERVGCPQCHAYVAKKTGPPFKQVMEKVKGNPSCVIKKLKTNKEHNDEGVTDDLKGPEFKIVADYLATRAK